MATTVNTLETDTEVFKGDRVVADGVERELGDVTTTSTTDSLTVGTATAIATYTLDNGTTGLLGGAGVSNAYDIPIATNVTYSAGKFGSAVNLTPTSDVQLPTHDWSQPNWSISFFLKVARADITQNYTGIIDAFIGSTSGFAIDLPSSTNKAIRVLTQGKGEATAVVAIPDNIWTHIVLVVSSTDVTMYQDNVSIISYANAGTIVNNAENIHLGGDGASTFKTTMSFDQVRIFPTALTPTEVTALYNETVTKYSADFNTPLASIPTSVYRLDHDNLTIDGTPTATTATVLDSRTGLIASGDTVLLDGVGVVCNPVVESVATVGSLYELTASYSYNNENFTLTSAPSAISTKFGNSGLKMYVLSNTNNTIVEYNLSTTYDITTAVVSGNVLDVSTQNTAQGGFCISSDGLHIYLGGDTSDIVYQYDFSVAWDISTATYSTKSLNVSATDTAVTFVEIKPDGTKIFIGGNSTDIIMSYDLGTPYDLATATNQQTKSLGAINTSVKGLAFSSDGTKALYSGGTSWTIYQLYLSVAWDISTITQSGTTINCNTIYGATANGGLDWDGDGGYFILTEGTNNKVHKTFIGSSTPKYDLTYPTQTAPTRIALANNDIVPTVASDTFDGTDTFTRTYNKVTKTARDVEYGFVADTDVEIVQLNLNQNMEP